MDVWVYVDVVGECAMPRHGWEFEVCSIQMPFGFSFPFRSTLGQCINDVDRVDT